jgi:hypothetical protein
LSRPLDNLLLHMLAAADATDNPAVKSMALDAYG